MALIELNEVTRHVPLPTGEDLHILKGVNLRVDAGERISIVGRSGTGKSTLLNIIGLLDRPSSGSYIVDGKDALKLGEGRRSQMRGNTFGFVFQQFNIFNARTAQENVEVPLLYTSGSQFWRRHDLAAQMLGRVGLEDRLDSYPTEMSGGEQQRIAIARALVRKPRIILADEPTGALDPDTGRSVMSLLEEVAAENNAALIVITHDLNVAVRADHVLSLYDGVLHTVDNAREVLVPTEIGRGATQSDGSLSAQGDGQVPAGTPSSLMQTEPLAAVRDSHDSAPAETDFFIFPDEPPADIAAPGGVKIPGDVTTVMGGDIVEDSGVAIQPGDPADGEEPPARAWIRRWKRRTRHGNA